MIDTHCHLDDCAYDAHLPILLENARKNNVELFIIPGANPRDINKAYQLSHTYNEIYFAVGVHPHYAQEYDENLLRKYIEDEKCIAVGECGLDYFRLPKDEEYIKQKQKEVFHAHIKLAQEYDKPLILHIRESSNDAYEIINQYEQENIRGVLHCYNADSILLKLSKNFYYGIGGVLTFKNARRLVDILPSIPLERLLLETDAPYLTPEPHRGKCNTPEYIPLIAEKIASLLHCSLQSIAEITTANAHNLFWSK